VPILSVYDDTHGRGVCRSCLAAIVWYELTSGKRHPFDGEPVYVRTRRDADGRLVAEIDTSVSPSHFQTCKDAALWRRK